MSLVLFWNRTGKFYHFVDAEEFTFLQNVSLILHSH